MGARTDQLRWSDLMTSLKAAVFATARENVEERREKREREKEQLWYFNSISTKRERKFEKERVLVQPYHKACYIRGYILSHPTDG